MNSKIKSFKKLSNLGKILSFSPPDIVLSKDIDLFKEKFESQLKSLISQDMFGANQTILIGGNKKSEEQMIHDLLTNRDETLHIRHLISQMVEIWIFLRKEVTFAPFPFEPDDFIAKLLILIDIIRRKDVAAAFGSKSKSQQDEVLRPAKEISKKLMSLEANIDNEQVYGLSPSIKLLFINAIAAFQEFHDALKSYESKLNFDDTKFASIYNDMQKITKDKGYVTKIINALIKDLMNLGFDVGSKYKDGSWTKKLADSKKYKKRKSSNK